MIKVLYFNSPHEPFHSAITDGRIVDGEYMKLLSEKEPGAKVQQGDPGLIHAAFIVLDTAENREKLLWFQMEYAAWKIQEPNQYALMNSLTRPRRLS